MGSVPDRSSKQEFASTLWELAELEDADSTRRSFKARAYRRAVWSLDHLSPALDEPMDELLAVPGIGSGIAKLIDGYRRSGRLARLEALRTELPARSGELARLPRMTPRRLRQLKEDLGIEDAQGLRDAIASGSVQTLPGLGSGSAEVWRRRLDAAASNMSILRATGQARALVGHLSVHVPDVAVSVTGAVRRMEEEVESIELLAVGDAPRLRAFLAGSALVTEARFGERWADLDTLVGRVTVHDTPPARAGSALVATTGPDDHVRVLEDRLGARQLEWAHPTEPDVYAAVGMAVPPPTARGADVPPRPDLVEARDLTGDLHVHSDWSPDGRQTLSDIVATARRRGLRYVAVTDHAANLGFGGLTADDLVRQREAIAAVREENPDVLILHGAELNIGRDGSLDYDDEVLAWLDFRLAAVHSFFDLPVVEQTDRVLRVVTHPLVHAVAHLTGRRIGIRPPIEVDVEAVVDAAAEHRTALEVNGHLDRLDLSAAHAARAVAGGALLVADSDAHRPSEVDNLANAVGVLQRARCPASLVANTWSAEALQAWLGESVQP